MERHLSVVWAHTELANEVFAPISKVSQANDANGQSSLPEWGKAVPNEELAGDVGSPIEVRSQDGFQGIVQVTSPPGGIGHFSSSHPPSFRHDLPL